MPWIIENHTLIYEDTPVWQPCHTGSQTQQKEQTMSTIVGYMFNADNYCPDHILAAMPFGPGGKFDGWRLAPGVVMPLEDNLHSLAWGFNIDRNDETTFDSDDFPKVIYRDQATWTEQCGTCGVYLDGYDEHGMNRHDDGHPYEEPDDTEEWDALSQAQYERRERQFAWGLMIAIVIGAVIGFNLPTDWWTAIIDAWKANR